MFNVNPKNGNDTKSDIFPWDIFKSDTIAFLLNNINKKISISTTFKIKLSPFYD